MSSIKLLLFCILSCCYNHTFCQKNEKKINSSPTEIHKDSLHRVILFLVDKKGIETGEIDSINGWVYPCERSHTTIINKKPFLGKIETVYADCTGKWLRIEFYFLGIRTRTLVNTALQDKEN